MLTSPDIRKTKIFTKYCCEKTTFYLVAVFQVLTNPPLLFCDEPTSGLDSFMSASVMELMREMAKQVHNEQEQERRHLGFFSTHNSNILWTWTKKIPEGMFSTGYFLCPPSENYPSKGEGNGQCIVGTRFGMEALIKICA
jgi:hypothetical protein